LGIKKVQPAPSNDGAGCCSPQNNQKSIRLILGSNIYFRFFLGEKFIHKKHHPQRQICHWNPLRGLVAEGVGLISAYGLHPCGAAFGSL